MQNEDFQRMLGVLREARLTPQERNKIRSRLLAFMREHPVHAPFTLRAYDAFASTFGVFTFRPIQLALASLVIVFAVGAGTSYAAENSLPGNPLYSIKIHVNEPIQGAFAVSPQEKAQWNAQLAARRLSEAEVLAAQNQLNASTSADIAAGLDRATEDFDANVAVLASSTTDVATVIDLQSSMEATLSVHAQVLSQIAGAMPESHEIVAPLLSGVADRVRAINGAQASINAQVIGNAEEAQRVARAQRDAALGQLGEAQALAAHISASSSESIDSDTAAAQTAIQAGEDNLAHGNYGAAMATFQAANLAAHEAKVRAYVANQIQGMPGVVLPTTTIPVEVTSGIQVDATTSIDPHAQDPENVPPTSHKENRNSENDRGDLNGQIGL